MFIFPQLTSKGKQEKPSRKCRYMLAVLPYLGIRTYEPDHNAESTWLFSPYPYPLPGFRMALDLRIESIGICSVVGFTQYIRTRQNTRAAQFPASASHSGNMEKISGLVLRNPPNSAIRASLLIQYNLHGLMMFTPGIASGSSDSFH